MVRSMSRKGRGRNNARMEGFFGTLKAEPWHPRDWSGWAPVDLMAEVDRWMRWFREGRRSQALGWLTPAEHRRAPGYAVQDVQENVRSPEGTHWLWGTMCST